jgi:methyl-accepting chemotaxis protein
MSLRFKIMSGFLILALMLAIAGIWSIYELNSIGTSVQDLLDENYRSIKAAEMMVEALERQDSGILLLLLGKWEEGQRIINSGDDLFQKNYRIAENNVTIPGEGDLIGKIKQKYMIYKNNWKKPIIGTDKQGNLDWYFRNPYAEFSNVKSAVNELKELNEATLYRTASDLKNRANRAVMPGTVAVISALIFSFLFTYFVNLYMVNPIRRMIRGIEDFLKRDKEFDVSVETNDEISHLSSAIRSLCSRVSPAEGDR